MAKRIFGIVVPAIILPVIPILMFRHLPLVDYPNHLAELQIRKTIISNMYIASFYEFSWRFIPHLGLDLVATPLLPFFSVEVIGRIIICVTFVTICLVTMLLDRELNEDNWGLSIFAGILLYNGAFMWGFISYIIGVAFAILSFYVWVRYRNMP